MLQQNSEADSDDNSSVASTGTKGSAISTANRPPGSAAASRLTANANSKPVVPPIPSKLAPTAPTPTQTGKITAAIPNANATVPAAATADEESSSVSWSSRKATKSNYSNQAPASKLPSVPPSDDGSEDGPRPSTGSFKTNVGTKGASFTVDDWQPDFNGSEVSAQGLYHVPDSKNCLRISKTYGVIWLIWLTICDFRRTTQFFSLSFFILLNCHYHHYSVLQCHQYYHIHVYLLSIDPTLLKIVFSSLHSKL